MSQGDWASMVPSTRSGAYRIIGRSHRVFIGKQSDLMIEEIKQSRRMCAMPLHRLYGEIKGVFIVVAVVVVHTWREVG